MKNDFLNENINRVIDEINSRGKVSESFDDIFNKAIEIINKPEESKMPDLSKDDIVKIQKKLLEMVNEDEVKDLEPIEDEDKVPIYFGSSGDDSYYAVIDKDDDGLIVSIELYSPDGEKISTLNNEDKLDNLLVLDKLVSDLSLDSISYKLLKDLGIIETEYQEQKSEEGSEEPEKKPEEPEKKPEEPEKKPEEPEESKADDEDNELIEQLMNSFSCYNNKIPQSLYVCSVRETCGIGIEKTQL